jgi:Bacterial Ig domain
MFSKNILFVASCAFSVLLFSCAKNKPKLVTDITSPVVSITTPINNSTFKSEGPISIVGTATDNSLATMQLTVFNVTDTSVIYKKASAISGSGITIQQTYTKYFPTVKKCLLEIIVTDASGNRSVDSARFTVN